MTEQYQLWITNDVSSWESPVTIKALRRRLTKMAKVAPDNATVTVERKDTGNGGRYTRIAAHWYEWK